MSGSNQPFAPGRQGCASWSVRMGPPTGEFCACGRSPSYHDLPVSIVTWPQDFRSVLGVLARARAGKLTRSAVVPRFIHRAGTAARADREGAICPQRRPSRP